MCFECCVFNSTGGLSSTSPKELTEAVLAMEDTFANLQIWTDLGDAHFVLLHARREALQGRPASALR